MRDIRRVKVYVQRSQKEKKTVLDIRASRSQSRRPLDWEQKAERKRKKMSEMTL